MADIAAYLDRRKRDGLLRVLRPAEARRRGTIRVGGKDYLDLSSNDYLGLSGHPRLAAAAKEAIDAFGTSSCASRLMSGDLELHHRLEEAVASFKGKEAAVVFNSGYQANVGIISALCGRGDRVFADRLCHASIIDGILLSGAELHRFRHNDTGHLDALLAAQGTARGKALIVTETVFSMDGDIAPLKELVGIKKRHGCLFMVDEAHATGVFGPTGSGIAGECGLAGEVDLIMGTFGKALGGSGAYVAASGETVRFLINACRSFIYSTALPPAAAAADLAALDVVREEPGRRARVLERAAALRAALRDKGFEVRGSTQIVPVIIGDSRRTAAFADALRGKGYWTLPVRPPTVPEREARIRLSLTYDHDTGCLEKLVKDMGDVRV